MPEETDAKSFFENVPSTYGATSAAVMDAPEPKPKVEEKPVTSAPVTPATTEKKPEPAESKGAGFDDLLSKEGDGQPKKTAAQFAEERRQAKAQKREAIEKAPVLEEENRKLKADFEAAQARLQEYEALNSRERQEQMVSQEDIENLRAERDAANRRYIAAHGPDFDPYQDPDVVRHAKESEDALRANLPKFALRTDGTRIRINIDLLQKQSPERKAAIHQAVAQYAIASEAADEAGLDKAVALMGTALGGIDIDDDDTRTALETALHAASDPFAKGMSRFRHVQENAVDFARQRRAQAAKQVEDRLFTPLRFDPEAIEATLEKDPSHAWANFGALINEMPDEIRSNVETTLRQDAAVLGALRFNPPPLPANASSQEIADHEAFVQGAEKRIEEITHLVTAARFLMGGAMVHLISQSREARERLESESESTSIPRRGSSGNEETPKGAAGIWGQISSNYRRS